MKRHSRSADNVAQGPVRAKRMALAICLFVVPILANANWHSDTQPIMGTRVHVELFVEDAQVGAQLLSDVMEEMHRIDNAFSSYQSDSELSQMNRLAKEGWVSVSDEMLDLLLKSRKVSQLTGGAFDITYASAGRYYDYREGTAPDQQTLDEAVQAINYEHVEIDTTRSRVRYKHPMVFVALGGIAKGHAVDRCIEILQAAGVGQASVSAGGDSRILGDRRGQPWNVGIAHPRKSGEMIAVLPLLDTAVSTSGDYERFFEKSGVRYHHILDPTTGRSADGAWSVTVLGPDTTLTDGLSTSVFVLGPERGLELVNRLPGIDAIVIDPHGTLLFSDDLQPLQ